MTMTLTEDSLHRFTGSESFFRHWCNRAFLYTEGAQCVAEQGQAYWLIDELALANQYQPEVTREPFQQWTLTVADDHTATLACDDGNGGRVFGKTIEFTDFPLAQIEFFVCENEFGPGHFTLMLPSEY